MLTIELVPKTCWYVNLRTILNRNEWDKIRKETYQKANYKCQICNAQGRIECHEIWSYDDKQLIQKLEGFVALCPLCHKVKHIGLAKVKGYYDAAINYLASVNGWTKEQAQNYIKKQFGVWKHRSQYHWKQDLSIVGIKDVKTR